MFNGPDYPQSLDEAQFDSWLEKGRESKISYNYLLIIWDAFETKYLPVYVEDRSKLTAYDAYCESVSNESLVAVYDLYSESRIYL